MTEKIATKVAAETSPNLQLKMGGYPLPRLKGLMDGEDKAALEEKLQALTEASMKLGEMAYRAAQEESAGAGADDGAADFTAETADTEEAEIIVEEDDSSDSSSSDDDEDLVVDADFTLEDDDEDSKSA